MDKARFSTVSYSNQLNNEVEQGQVKLLHIHDQSQPYTGYDNLVDEIRGYLVAYEGKSTEEGLRYSDILNKAVLGFPEEKDYLLQLINDQLIRKRVHDIVPPGRQYRTLAEAIFAEIVGLNILEVLIEEKHDLEEIQVVGTRIFEVRQGVATLSAYKFNSLKEVERIQQNLLLFKQDTLNPRKRWAEATMSDGSRVTLTGYGFTGEPTITIRFYTMKSFELYQLSQPSYETINDRMLILLQGFVNSYFNLVIIGATNSGKTSFMKALIGEMPEHERMVTIESRYEMMLKRDFPNRNIIEYEIDEEDSLHSSEQAFKLALRQSPKRIIHAEIRDQDANIYVRACTRGHEGSMTSLHANELEDVPEAITDMCLLDQRGLDSSRLTKRITKYVTQIGIQMAVVNGFRKIVRIVEYDYIDHEVVVRDVVRYDYHQGDWIYPSKLSKRGASRIKIHHFKLYERLTAMGMIELC